MGLSGFDQEGVKWNQLIRGLQLARMLVSLLEYMAKAKSALAKHYHPQVATLVKKVPEGDAWLHEIKYDGTGSGFASIEAQ